jgi:CRP/FNR family cyclic AMP-dependent transcriptional regulator
MPVGGIGLDLLVACGVSRALNWAPHAVAGLRPPAARPDRKHIELSRTLEVMKLPFNFLRVSADDQRIENLKGLSLFKRLTTRELRELDELLHERSYQKDEVIFDEGDAGLGLFIVVSGRVKVTSSHAALQRLAPEFGPGDFFGELALFEETQRTARVVALEPTQVLAFFRREFFSLLERDEGIGAKILFELSRTVVLRSRKLLTGQPHSPTV